MLGEGLGGPANASLGLQTVMSEIFRATRDALQELPDPAVPLSTLHAGIAMAGLVEAEFRDEFVHIVHPFASMTAETDAFVAQLGAFAGGDGGLLITGTGSCAFARVNDESFYIGGWGFPVSDQGSGARLGQLAARRALQAYDAILPASPFCDEILAATGSHPPEISRWARTAKPADYGALSSIVFDHAGKGDAVALELVRLIAGEIDQLIAALAARGVRQIHPIGGLATPIRPWLDPEKVKYLVEAKGDVFDGALRLIEGGGLVNKTGGGGK